MKRTLATALAVVFAVAAPAADAAEPQPLGRTCTPQNGVRFCAGSISTRVPSFDGVPLDVDVTLPPTGDGPFPAVAVPCGHGQSGKAAQQSICLALVSAGFVALTYDPIGQGERTQLLDKTTGKPLFGMTNEHTLLGASSMPVGCS